MEEPMGELLKIDHLSYSYPGFIGESPVISDVSFHINEGEFIAVTGPTGCGKSTLLSLIAGMLSPARGSITINGKDVKTCGKSLGYMLQKNSLLESMGTLRINPPDFDASYQSSDNSFVQINELMNTYGFVTFQDCSSPELPGGMRQRAALIRTLLLESDILLLDEPFSTLEPQYRRECTEEIRGLIRKEKKTALLVTADFSEAVGMADRVIILSEQPATVEQILIISQEEKELEKHQDGQ